MRAAMITGAASGIGLATAERLAKAGAAVILLDRNGHGLADAARLIPGAVTLTVDITDSAAVDRAVARAAAAFGRIDALANVAGIGEFSGDIVETTPDQWNNVLSVNLTGSYHVARAVIPHMRVAGGGSIVNVSSQYGLVGCLKSPAYCASKAGVIGLTKAMAVDHAQERIRVNCVCPGPVDTPMVRDTRSPPEWTEDERTRTAERLLLGRISSAEEIAAMIGFLLSEEAASTTGSVIAVDSGWTAG